MLMRWVSSLVLIFIVLSNQGCSPKAKVGMDEDKNPYLLAGRDWMASGNAAKARRNFEQALAVNPRSPLAHYEMGLLDERFDRDYVSAIYHYRQAMRLRPEGYPADNAKYRIESCKQELVKAELIAPVAQSMVRELERLKRENAQLKEQLESVSVRTASNQTGSGTRSTTAGGNTPGSVPRGKSAETPVKSESEASPATGVPSLHVVRKDETIYRIARTYHISPQKLLQANPGLNPRQLTVGRQLRIPK